MKKLIVLLLVLCLLSGLAGCATVPKPTETIAPETEPTESTPAEPVPTEAPQQEPMFSISLPIVELQEYHQDGTLLFTQSYQDITLILPDPDVASKITLHYLNNLDDTDRESAGILASAQSDYQGQSGWVAYSATTHFNVQRIDSNVLSLRGAFSSFTGAAHPTHIARSYNYAMITGEALTLEQILAEDASVTELLPLLTERLNAIQESKQLYPGFEQILKELLGLGDFSNWYFTLEGLSFSFSPYEIAPYVSGIIEVTVPYTQLQGILSDTYFPPEWAYEGSAYALSAEDTDITQFNQMCEISLHPGGRQIVLHSGSTAISNVIVEYGNAVDGQDFQAVATILAVATLTPGDAALLEVALSDVLPVLCVRYQSGQQTVTKYIMPSGQDGSILLVD